MTTVTTYYSDDGIEFDSEEECRDYEETILHSKDAAVFFDESLKMMTCPVPEDVVNYAFWIYIKDAEKARHLFKWLDVQVGFELHIGFKDGDILGYDENLSECWFNVRERSLELMRAESRITAEVYDHES